jgi:hypothetical protein
MLSLWDNLRVWFPRIFPKWAEPEVFRSVRIGKDGWALGSTRKVPGSKWKTAILQRMCSAYWVLSQLPLCYPMKVRPGKTGG